MEGQRIYRSPYPDCAVPAAGLAEFTLAHAHRWPTGAALVDGATGETWTYGQLLSGVARAADRLAAAGVGPGTRVGLSAPNQPSWAVAFYGALRLGASVVPLNPALTPDELRYLLAIARPTVAVADRSASAGLAEIAADPGSLTLVTLRALVDGAAPGPGGADGDPEPGSGRRDGPCGPAVAPGEQVAAGAPAVIAFSSGTTGRAKGVQLTHANLVANLVQHEAMYHVGPDDVVVAAVPLFHIYGMSIVLGYALRHGATVVTMPRFDLDGYCALVERYGVTWLHLVPPMARGLVSRRGTANLSSVRHAVNGAAPLDASVAAELADVLGCEVGQGYGMTEASPGVTWVPDDGSHPCPPGSVGVLVPGTEGRLVDPRSGRGAEGDTGELWVRGPQVMAGYLDDQASTAAVLEPGGWLRTGDVLRVSPEGTWWVVDRLKELIKYKGWHVAPAELEAVLLDHPAVADAAVAGVPDPEAGEIPVAWVVTRRALEPQELLDWVADRVTHYKKVRRVHLVDTIPRSPAGKVLRRSLAEPPVPPEPPEAPGPPGPSG